jgi:thiol-disulfide isomerase/thioredoxin
MYVVIGLVILLLIILLYLSKTTNDSYVSNVTGPNTPKVYDLPSFVMFYMPGCPPCEELKPKFEKLKAEYNGYNNVQILLVSSLDPEWDLGVYDISTFPTLRFYPSGLQVPESHIEYHGDRSYQDLVQFFLKPIGYWGNNPQDAPDYMKPESERPTQNPDASVNQLASFDQVGAAEKDALEQTRVNEYFGQQWQFYEPVVDPDFLAYRDSKDFANMGAYGVPNPYAMAPTLGTTGQFKYLRNEVERDYTNSQDLTKRAMGQILRAEKVSGTAPDSFIGNRTTGYTWESFVGNRTSDATDNFSPESAPVGSQPSDLNPLQRQTVPMAILVNPYSNIPNTTFGYSSKPPVTQATLVSMPRKPYYQLPSWPAQNNEGYRVDLAYSQANNTNDYIRGGK